MPTPTQTAVLLIDCPDRKGIVAAIANFLVLHYDANVLNADQHQDAELSLFFMRVEFTTEDPCSRAQFHDLFSPLAAEFHMNWRLTFSSPPRNVAIFVSHYLHCLADLLHRHQSGDRPSLVPTRLHRGPALSRRLCLRRQAHRSHQPLRHRQPRRRPHHRAGRH